MMQIKSIILGCGLATFSMLAFADSAANDQQSFSPAQIKNIQSVVHDYLVSHPEVLIEASQALQEKEMAATQAMTVAAISKNKTQLFDDTNSPAVGSTSPKAVLVEFFDYQCGHCKEMSPIIKDAMAKNPNLKIIYKQLPIFGGDSKFAAMAALASIKQGKFAQFHDALMSADNPLNQDKILSIARQVGINTDQMKKDMNSPDIDKQIKDNFALAGKIKLKGTPAFIFSDQKYNNFVFVPGSTSKEDLQKNIDKVAK